MQKRELTRILTEMMDEVLRVIAANDGYEKYRIYDDIFYLPEHDRAWVHCLLAVHERLVGKELLPGGKTKAVDDGSFDSTADARIRSLLKAIAKERKTNDRRNQANNAGHIRAIERTSDGD